MTQILTQQSVDELINSISSGTSFHMDLFQKEDLSKELQAIIEALYLWSSSAKTMVVINKESFTEEEDMYEAIEKLAQYCLTGMKASDVGNMNYCIIERILPHRISVMFVMPDIRRRHHYEIDLKDMTLFIQPVLTEIFEKNERHPSLINNLKMYITCTKPKTLSKTTQNIINKYNLEQFNNKL